jgi:hypothetical protein
MRKLIAGFKVRKMVLNNFSTHLWICEIPTAKACLTALRLQTAESTHHCGRENKTVNNISHLLLTVV